MDENLQFDKAEFDQAPLRLCKGCNTTLVEHYYQASGSIFCEHCAEGLRGFLKGKGSRAARLVRALVYGLGAAIGGSLLYYAILASTGYQIGLVAIVVGIMVGKAVRAGSGNRGGWRYQVLAAILTYVSIASTYVPLALRELRTHPEMAHSKPAIVQNAGTHATRAVPAINQPSTAPSTPESSASSEKAPSRLKSLPAPLRFAAAMVMLVGIALALPILAGASNLIGILIIAFGVWQAWVLNRRLTIKVTGPHPIVPSAHA